MDFWRQECRTYQLTQEQIEEVARLLGEKEASTEEIYLNEHATDWWAVGIKQAHSGLEVHKPGLVIWPANDEEVSKLLSWTQTHRVPVTPVGGQSSVVGGALPVAGGIALNMRRMNAVLALDQTSLMVTVQAGMMGNELEAYLQQRGYTLGHYPQSLELSTVGGWIATRASGTFSSKYGNIDDMVQGMRVVLPDGELVTIAPTPRSSTGPDLKEIFLGSEGTLGVITEVDLRIQRIPEVRRFRGFRFSELFAGLEAVREIVQSDLSPALVRLYNPAEAARVARGVVHLQGQCLLLLGWDGPAGIVDIQEELSLRICLQANGQDLGAEIGEHWFRNRFDVTTLQEVVRLPGRIVDTLEVSTLWSNAREVYEALTAALARHSSEVLAHFSHVYPTGTSLYVIFFLQEADDQAVVDLYSRAWHDAMEAALASGAAISHHHGIGLLRIPWIARQHGSGLRLLTGLKSLLDPSHILNPNTLLAEQKDA